MATRCEFLWHGQAAVVCYSVDIEFMWEKSDVSLKTLDLMEDEEIGLR